MSTTTREPITLEAGKNYVFLVDYIQENVDDVSFRLEHAAKGIGCTVTVIPVQSVKNVIALEKVTEVSE